MSRTHLMSAVRRAVRLALHSNQPSSPPVDELLEMTRTLVPTRRQFLRTGVAVAAGGLASLSGCDTLRPLRLRRGGPRVAIVGGGIAGLTAAWTLRRHGLHATIYEASKRTGGRIFSKTDVIAPRLVTELGAEFIDTSHEDLWRLIRAFDLEVLDTAAPSEAGLIPDAYFFDGRHYSEREVVEAFRPLAARMKDDYDALPEVVDFRHAGGAIDLDRTSLARYLDRIAATGFVRSLLEVAYVTEYGLNAEEQSALNLLFLIGLDTADDRFHVFGDSDERYKVRGGNQRITDALTERLDRQILREHRLDAVASAPDGGYTLTFSRDAASALSVRADAVILTLPFTLLRDVDLRVDLPDWKRRAITDLGYGTNAKLFAGFDRRAWRMQGFSGTAYSDETFQLVWDNARMQEGLAGGLTLYSGGRAGLAVGAGTPQQQAESLLPGVERVFPGILSARNGRYERFHWPTYPLSRGSYACYKPGQWTTIAGAEFAPVGSLHFAGEHCSYDFQGFMNGAAETGRRAAEAVLATSRVSA